ncbi:hypothetical protein C1645_113602 [Glomus cerebriforme]|uniref:RING-type domain-containing protein n=1 Tax=Glomus cerebriforme TaxID=658196 RepID=A0A397TKH8_9GLOM|nr:hypothetical protein C1645_113602 [Glomus cerebriforme]
MENQDSSVNTEATTVDEINIGPIGNTQSREKSSISESERPSLVNLKNLGYNILKSLDDETVGDIDFPGLDSCSECGNEILMSPLKAFSYLTCGHIFHRLCIEKKLFLGTPSACPAPGCGKNVDILDQADALGIVSNLPILDPRVTSQSSGISPLSNLMGTFTLSSPPIRMGGIEGTATQQVKSTLRCAKCSEDLFSSLPPLGFLRISPQPQGPPKPRVYLTCKHIVHYNCIDNPRKLCPICPSTDMEIDDLETPTEQNSSTAQKKRSSEFASEKDSNKKAKQTREQIDRNDSPTLKKLIMELTSPESLEDGLSRDPLITLQSSVSEMDVILSIYIIRLVLLKTIFEEPLMICFDAIIILAKPLSSCSIILGKLVMRMYLMLKLMIES